MIKNPDILQKIVIGQTVAFSVFAALYYSTGIFWIGLLFLMSIGVMMLTAGWWFYLKGETSPLISYYYFRRKKEPVRYWLFVGFFIGGGIFSILWIAILIFTL